MYGEITTIMHFITLKIQNNHTNYNGKLIVPLCSPKLALLVILPRCHDYIEITALSRNKNKYITL